MDTQYGWVTQLWDELRSLEPAEQIKVSGEWIVYLTQKLSPQLAGFRRGHVALLVAQPDWDSRKLAETIGASVATIDRLAKEGRQGGAT